MGVTISGINSLARHPRRPELEDPRFVSWSYGNAVAMFGLLGLFIKSEAGLTGEAPVADIRRAIVRARATFERRAPGFERAEVIQHGAPRTHADGSIELRPVRAWSMGLDTEGMRVRLDAFERAIHELARRGATHITWA
jgi:hypothetical protein